jgi:thymidylate synthase
MFWKGIVTELLWFLKGDTNIKYLVDNGVNIWNEDAYNYYYDKSPAKNNDGEEQNIILQPVSLKENSRNPSPKNVDSYSMFQFDEFISMIKNTPKEELPTYEGYTLGDCGYQYGRVWRAWEGYKGNWGTDGVHKVLIFGYLQEKIDQIANVINSLKTSPEGRRHIVTAIDPAHQDDLALYWCHALFQFNCRPLTEDERLAWADREYNKRNIGPDRYYQLDQRPKYYLDCQLYQRSADAVLGVPFNIASYALLTHIIAKIVNMVPGEFIHTFGDVHIYDNHWDAVEEQLSREPRALPTLKFSELMQWDKATDDLTGFFDACGEWEFDLEGYNPHPAIKAELSTGLIK